MDITDGFLQHEQTIRLVSFFGVLGLMALWELLMPRRPLSVSKTMRWANNLGLVFFNTVLLRLLFPATTVGVSAFAAELGWGLLNYYHLPFWLSVVSAVVAMDFVIYLQHVMVHAVPLLWRLHRVHHADLDYDVTTGVRFHPGEIIISMLIKFATITVLGAPVVAVVIFEVVLNTMSMFNHGNVRIPVGLDRLLRMLLVTPDMHRVHHSVEDDEANSNFGFSLSVWDHLFGSYRSQPRAGHEGMTIGIHHYRTPAEVTRFDGLLFLPFRGKVTEYAINRRQWNDNDN